MRRTLDSSLSALGLLWRVVPVVAAVVLVPAMVCAAGEQIHAYRHPAPLGRTAEAMLQRLDSVLPAGTTVDSASRYLQSLGLRTEVYGASEAPRSLPGDTLLAGGPAVVAVLADTESVFSGAFGGWLGAVSLYFTPAGQLAGRAAKVIVVNPL